MPEISLSAEGIFWTGIYFRLHCNFDEREDQKMKAPKEFTKKTCREFGDQIQNQIQIPEGVEMESAGGTFDGKTFTMKLKFTLTDCARQSTEELMYNSFRHAAGLPEWGFSFRTFDGEEFVMTDYKPRSPKFPIIARNVVTGKLFKFDVERIKIYLKAMGEDLR
jgi:hypothetical protein